MDYCFVIVADSIFLPSMVNEEMDSLNAIIPNLFPNYMLDRRQCYLISH